MADITPRIPAGRKIIQSYGGGGFRISGEDHAGSVLVLPEDVLAWNVSNAGEITTESLSALSSAAREIDVLLIGTGASMAYLEPEIRAALKAMGIVAEAMDTGAASRTFNVLISEDRRAAAALIAVD